jgi:uncharacterized membrane protein YecN with MAPEG domain
LQVGANFGSNFKGDEGELMIILPVTLTAAGLAALLNIWIANRVGRVRGQEKVSIGDGGNARLIAAMRAHANYVEYTPFVLVLLGFIEVAVTDKGTNSPWWLWTVAILYLVGRVAHALGMTIDNPLKLRLIGTVVTLLTLLGLGVYAITLPHLQAPHQVIVNEG